MNIDTPPRIIHANAKVSMRLIDGEIFHMIYHENQLFERSDFEDHLLIYNDFSQGTRYKVLHEIQHGATATLEARKYGESIDVNVIAEAFVFSNLAQRLLVRFHKLTTRNKHPIRVFAQKEKAIHWLDKM